MLQRHPGAWNRVTAEGILHPAPSTEPPSPATPDARATHPPDAPVTRLASPRSAPPLTGMITLVLTLGTVVTGGVLLLGDSPAPPARVIAFVSLAILTAGMLGYLAGRHRSP